MTNDDDIMIRNVARALCAEQEAKGDTNNATFYLNGEWDHTVWMRLAEACVRKGLEIGRLL